MRFKILLFGKNGQVGQAMQEYQDSNIELISYNHAEANFKDAEKLRQIIDYHKPNIIINAVAFTDVYKAEFNYKNTYLVNAFALKTIAEEAQRVGAWLFHYSTNYVFDGNKEEPYLEEDPANPLNVYGKTKLLGEQFIAQSCEKYLIFRTSWVYSSYRDNFLTKILNGLKKGVPLKVVDDQFGVPTSADLIASISWQIVNKIFKGECEKSIRGIYHLVPAGKTTWFAYAKIIGKYAEQFKIKSQYQHSEIKAITTEIFNPLVKTPRNSIMHTGKLEKIFDVTLPDWHYHIKIIIKKLS